MNTVFRKKFQKLMRMALLGDEALLGATSMADLFDGSCALRAIPPGNYNEFSEPSIPRNEAVYKFQVIGPAIRVGTLVYHSPYKTWDGTNEYHYMVDAFDASGRKVGTYYTASNARYVLGGSRR